VWGIPEQTVKRRNNGQARESQGNPTEPIETYFLGIGVIISLENKMAVKEMRVVEMDAAAQ
jgi:hypothetical protein